MVNCRKVMNSVIKKIVDIKILSNVNELQDKIIQVDKLLEEIRNLEIIISIEPVESSQKVHR